MELDRRASSKPLFILLIAFRASCTLLVGMLKIGIPASLSILKAIAFSLAGNPSKAVK